MKEYVFNLKGLYYIHFNDIQHRQGKLLVMTLLLILMVKVMARAELTRMSCKRIHYMEYSIEILIGFLSGSDGASEANEEPPYKKSKA